MKDEKYVEKQILIGLSAEGCRVFKNFNGNVFTRDGTQFKVGFGDGTSDIIGITPKLITPDMVGKTVGVFTAIEVKKEKDGAYGATPEQLAFINTIKRKGGLAGVAYDLASAKEIIK